MEARDAARHIHEQGRHAPLLLIPRSPLGDRISNAFARVAKLGGGVVLAQNLALPLSCVWGLTAVPALR